MSRVSASLYAYQRVIQPEPCIIYMYMYIYIYAYVGHCRTTDEEVHVEHAGIQTRWLRCFYLSLNRLPTSSKPVDLQVMRLAEDLLNSLEMGWAKTL